MRIIEVLRDGEWRRVRMGELLVGDLFRLWEDEAKNDYIGEFCVAREPERQENGVWGVVAEKMEEMP